MSINPRKASGPDGIPAWLLKENADLLSDTISDIINSSFAERRLPPSWKSADTLPIPKQKPIKDVNKHLRPISLTSILSKVAEEFVVAEYLRPSILKKIGDNQFGAIPKSSTTHALIWCTPGPNTQTVQDLIFYRTCIHPVMEYACPVFHDALPAMRIIFPFVPYSDALNQANLATLSQRRQSITTKLFDSITCNSDHKLYKLLPPQNNCELNLRRKRKFNVPLAKTKRLMNTFIYNDCS